MTKISGIHWFRRRQRTLARAALALFALAWLQAAAVPCAMAHDMGGSAPAVPQLHDGGHAGHGPGHDGHAGHGTPQSQGPHCPYCPPSADADGAACDHASNCAFPHDPRIDARTLNALLGPPPIPLVALEARLEVPALRSAAGDPARDVPRRPLAISFCRFIE